MLPRQPHRFKHRFLLPAFLCAQISMERARDVWERKGDNLVPCRISIEHLDNSYERRNVTLAQSKILARHLCLGGTPYDGQYGEALHVTRRAHFSAFKHIKGYRNLSFQSVKRPKRTNRRTLWLWKRLIPKFSYGTFTASKRDALCLKLDMCKQPFVNRSYTKRGPFLSKMVYLSE